MLADFGANLTAWNGNGLTPLHLAILTDRRDIMEDLIERKVNLNVEDKDGRTPLDLSIELGRFCLKITHLKLDLNRFASGKKSTIEYLIVNNAEVPKILQEWKQLALGCALRGKSAEFNFP